MTERKQVQFLVKLRDSALMLAEAADDYIDSLAPPEVKGEKKQDFDAEKLQWETIPAKDNPKGPWERTPKSSDPNFISLYSYIREKGNVRLQGSTQFWILNDGAIGRRIKKT